MTSVNNDVICLVSLYSTISTRDEDDQILGYAAAGQWPGRRTGPQQTGQRQARKVVSQSPPTHNFPSQQRVQTPAC